jgi:POT family proton-dependent oligopeptide transporter
VCGYLAQSVAFKGWLGENGFNPVHSWHWGFAAAGVGMTLGLVQYVLGGRRLARVGGPPKDGPRPWRTVGLILLGTAGLLTLVVLSDQVPSLAWIRYAYLGAPLAAIVWCGLRRDVTSKRVTAILLFFIAATVFWAIFEQAGSTIALFGDRLTDRTLAERRRASRPWGIRFSVGSPFPSSWFQGVNSAFVMVMAPRLRMALGAPGQPPALEPAQVRDRALPRVALLRHHGARGPPLGGQGLVSPWWIVSLFFIQTLGELCLSPVGLSLMTKLAPDNLVGLSLGIWFLASAFGNKLAGILAGSFTATDSAALAHSFMTQALWAAATAAVILGLTPWMKRLMGGVR